jgi:hypothetical protein
VELVTEETMGVRAKFVVQSITESNSPKSEKQEDGTYKPVPGKMSTIKMTPVYANGDPNHENTKFWQASPSGELTLNCVNPQAVEQFIVGHEYYLDFTPVE